MAAIKNEGAKLVTIHSTDEWEGFPELVGLLWSLQHVTA